MSNQIYGSAIPSHGSATGFASATDTTLTTVIPAPSPGLWLMITKAIVSNSHATINSRVRLYSGTTQITGAIPAPATGGSIVNFDPPLPLKENEALNFAADNSVTTIEVTAHGYVTDQRPPSRYGVY